MIGGLKQAVVLQRAKDYCKRYDLQLIGVSGSWGRDVTIHALATALSDYTTLRVGAPARNPIEVAASLLGVTSKDLGWLSLLGKSRIQEIIYEEPKTIITDIPSMRPGFVDALARTLPFSVGIVTNVHSSHLQYFSSKETVAHELLSLPASLTKKDIAVLNIDDPYLATFTDNIKGKVIGFGTTAAADVRLVRMHEAMAGGFAVELHIGRRIVEGYFPHLFTSLQVYSVVAAIAALYAITNNAQAAANAAVALARFKPPVGHGSMHEAQGVHVFDDTYAATPESMFSGLHALSKRSGRRVAILGDITELGGQSVSLHEAVGEAAADAAHIFMAVGDSMRAAQTIALKSEHEVDVHHFEEAADAGKWMRQYLRSGDAVYVAGSGEMEMNVVTKRLLESSN